MIEQQIENRVIGKVASALSATGISVQYARQLQATEGVKALENSSSDVFVIAKASPRSYSTATIPTCQIPVSLNVLVRADVDYNGVNYLDVTSKVMDILENW